MVFVAAAELACGEILREEVFDLSPGTLLSTTTAGDGWSSGWKADVSLTTDLASSFDVTAGSLSNAVFGTRGLYTTGNRFEEDGGPGVVMWRGLSSTVEWSGDSVTYISTLVRWGGNHPTSASHFYFVLGDIHTRFGFSADGETSNKFRLSVRNTSAHEQFGTTLYDSGTVYLLVAKIETAASGSGDTISLALFEPGETLPSTEPTWDVSVSTTRSDTASALGVDALFYFGGRMASFDELRIGRIWDDATVPQSQIPVVDPLVAFLDSMDLDMPGMGGVKTLHDAGQHVEALDAWRDIVLADLRAAPMGEFGWHAAKTVGYELAWADVLIGAMTEAEYIAYLESIDRTYCFDAWGLSGAGAVSNADWLAVPADSLSETELASFKAFISLTVKYWQTRSSTYGQKWFGIASDFSRNCYTSINPLPLTAKQNDYPYLQWNGNASSALSQAWRVENTFKSMAVVTKSVPGGSIASSWMESLEARPDTLAPGAYDLFPAQQLADVASSLMEEHSIALKSRYLVAGAVPNQQFSGLYALLLTSRFFDMFYHVQTDITPQADAAMLNFVESTVSPDGGMLEQSLNYNESDAGRMAELLDVYSGSTKAWTFPMQTSVDVFWRMVWALRGPTFSTPQIGNGHCDIAPEVWISSSMKDNWIQSQLDDYPAAGSLEQQINGTYGGTVSNTPVFTSIAFPYAGYYIQRSGWTLDDRALFFMGGRPQRGHYMCDKNAVQLSAFGRDLLTTGGSPTYGYTHTDFPPEVDAYLSEQSSAKVNTIMVDDKSQNRTDFAPQVHTNTVDALWHASDHFDLVEGMHIQGYGSEMDVSHQRLSVFVKEAGLWVLTDNLFSQDTDSHTYRQVWNFQPYKTDEGTPVYGFKEYEVVVDQENHRIYTSDSDTADTPNVWLYSFGGDVSYQKYYASTNPCYGWYARGIGDGIPAVDVHTIFSAAGDQQLVTLVKPVEGLSDGLASIADAGGGAVNGFDCTTDSGVEVGFRSTLQSGTTLAAQGISAQADTLLVSACNLTVRGVVVGADRFASGNLDLQGLGGKSFEFEVVDINTVKMKDLLVPQGFEWVDTGAGAEPDYHYSATNWYIMTLTEDELYAIWLADYPTLGSNTNKTDNPDGDALDNGSEYIAGTDPTDPESVFAVSSFLPNPSAVETILGWSSAAGRIYSISWTSNLVNGFSLIQDNLAFPINSYTDTTERAESSNFYQIKVRKDNPAP